MDGSCRNLETDLECDDRAPLSLVADDTSRRKRRQAAALQNAQSLMSLQTVEVPRIFRTMKTSRIAPNSEKRKPAG
jgi:hypothetical protein